jgi:hypothetical protein
MSEQSCQPGERVKELGRATSPLPRRVQEASGSDPQARRSQRKGGDAEPTRAWHPLIRPRRRSGREQHNRPAETARSQQWGGQTRGTINALRLTDDCRRLERSVLEDHDPRRK